MKNLLVLLVCLLVFDLQAAEFLDEADISALFEQTGVTGTFVLFHADEAKYHIHNPERAQTRYVPASTFKVPNSLIGLATGAVTSVDEVLPYGGQPQYMKAWEQDMGLRQAIRISNVPIYQELARRIGLKPMAAYVALLDYGNKDIGGTIDMFWLQGPLKISAIEQARFMAALASKTLPLADDIQSTVGEIIRVDEGDDWSLHAKTGWGTIENPAIGWWAGWVEKQGTIYGFALNMDMPDVADAPKRISLGKSSLRILEVLP